ncbi:MAG: hypothetical protein HOH13_02820 [Crocinitomicaceae bacterium]|nr:hypothetical protein [Crocinitomicaceae bacterium]
MNTIKVLIILCFLPTFLFGQNSIDENGLKQGAWSKKWENGKTRYKGQFEDDKAVGVFYYWYADGSPQSILSYIGKAHVAYCKIYGIDGNIAATGKYIDQMKDSTWLYYDYQGRLRSKNNYNEGLMEGEQVTYSYKGKIVEIIDYYDDKKHGEWVQFYDNGAVRLKGNWNEGFPNGKIYKYRESGALKSQGQYKDSKKHGYWRLYTAGGDLEKKVYYLEGNLIEGKALKTYEANIQRRKDGSKNKQE